MRILIVDDDETARELLRNVLEQAGHEVDTAANGRQALDQLRARPCQMVISDWVMPEKTGVELCRDIRAGDFPNYVYVILLTSRDRVEDIVEGLSAGADDFIRKPFDPGELYVRIQAGERVLALESRELVIFALAKLAESRDPETGAHLERIRQYARILAQQLLDEGNFPDQMNAEFVRLIYLASPLHDIGKVGIPDSVLLKPGRLSPREFEIMKQHTLIGAETLSASLKQNPHAGLLRMARDIALTHHERYDGTGYPAELAGRNIPLCGRIVALADVYDALTSKRVYKGTFSHEIARALIVNESGTHFDPLIVDAFVKREMEFLEVQTMYADGQAAAVA